MKKKNIVILIILSCIIIAAILINNHVKIAEEKARKDAEWNEGVNLANELESKFKDPFKDIFDIWANLDKGYTTEMIIEKNPRKEYLDNLSGKNILVYGYLEDIRQDKENRSIIISGESNEHNRNIKRLQAERWKDAQEQIIRTRGYPDIDFYIFDNNNIITNVSVNDKIVFEVIVNKIENIDQNFLDKLNLKTINILLTVIRMEENWETSSFSWINPDMYYKNENGDIIRRID